jgi:hypothetical protein
MLFRVPPPPPCPPPTLSPLFSSSLSPALFLSSSSSPPHQAKNDKLQKENSTLHSANITLQKNLEEKKGAKSKGDEMHNINFETPIQRCVKLLQSLASKMTSQQDTETLTKVIDLMESDVSMHTINVTQKIEDQSPKDGVGPVTNDFKHWLNSHFSDDTSHKGGKSAPSSLTKKPAVPGGLHRECSFTNAPGSTSTLLLVTPEVDPKINSTIRATIDQWDFNIFELEDHMPLYSIGCYLFIEKFDWVNNFNIPKANIEGFLYRADREYSFDPANPNIYHKSLHAADVLQSTYCLLQEEEVKAHLAVDNALDTFCLLLSAAMHDFKHKGVTNNFLVKVHDDLALRYSDESVLERYHCYQTFKMLRNESFALFQSFSEEEYFHCRKKIIQLILATDLKLSFEVISSFDVARRKIEDAKNGNGKQEVEENFDLKVMKMMLKLSDIGHPCKTWDIHLKWSDKISDEFFAQGCVCVRVH